MPGTTCLELTSSPASPSMASVSFAEEESGLQLENDETLSRSEARVVMTETCIAIALSAVPCWLSTSCASSPGRGRLGHDWLYGPCGDGSNTERRRGSSAAPELSTIRVTVCEKTSACRAVTRDHEPGPTQVSRVAITEASPGHHQGARRKEALTTADWNIEWHRPYPMTLVKNVTVNATDESVKIAADWKIEPITRHLTARRREPSGRYSRTLPREIRMGFITSAGRGSSNL